MPRAIGSTPDGILYEREDGSQFVVPTVAAERMSLTAPEPPPEALGEPTPIEEPTFGAGPESELIDPYPVVEAAPADASVADVLNKNRAPGVAAPEQVAVDPAAAGVTPQQAEVLDRNRAQPTTPLARPVEPEEVEQPTVYDLQAQDRQQRIARQAATNTNPEATEAGIAGAQVRGGDHRREAIDARHDANLEVIEEEARAADRAVGIIDDARGDTEEAVRVRDEAVAETDQKIAALNEEWRENPLKPGEAWRNLSGWRKAVSIMSVAFGVWGIRVTNGRNYALEAINKLMDDDLTKQRAKRNDLREELNRQQTRLKNIRATFADTASSIEVEKAAKFAALRHEMEKRLAGAKTAEEIARREEALAALAEWEEGKLLGAYQRQIQRATLRAKMLAKRKGGGGGKKPSGGVTVTNKEWRPATGTLAITVGEGDNRTKTPVEFLNIDDLPTAEQGEFKKLFSGSQAAADAIATMDKIVKGGDLGRFVGRDREAFMSVANGVVLAALDAIPGSPSEAEREFIIDSLGIKKGWVDQFVASDGTLDATAAAKAMLGRLRTRGRAMTQQAQRRLANIPRTDGGTVTWTGPVGEAVAIDVESLSTENAIRREKMRQDRKDQVANLGGDLEDIQDSIQSANDLLGVDTPIEDLRAAHKNTRKGLKNLDKLEKETQKALKDDKDNVDLKERLREIKDARRRANQFLERSGEQLRNRKRAKGYDPAPGAGERLKERDREARERVKKNPPKVSGPGGRPQIF